MEQQYATTLKIEIDESLHGRTVKGILRQHLGLSAAMVKRLKQTEHGIVLNLLPVHVDKQVQAGDVLTLLLWDTPSRHIVPRPIPLEILYEDEGLLAVNKPRGMPTHPSQNHHEDTLANGVMEYYKERAFTFRAVTRLDKDTSGVVLIAKHGIAAQRMSDAMQARAVQKEYLAVVNGIPHPPWGRIDAPIGRCKDSVILRCVSLEGKEAVTDYRVEESKNGVSLVRLMPMTGRTHQLRAHLSHIGTPIWGDDLYGAPQMDDQVRLHCSKVSFAHPMTGEPISLFASLPQDMISLIR